MSFQAYLDNIKAKTGKTPEDFKKLAEKKGLLKLPVKAGPIITWLKEDFELGHGHAMAIYSTFTTLHEAKADKGAALDKHFAGSKEAWRPVFDGLMKKLNAMGSDIEVAPTNTYLSLLRTGKKFAVVQALTDRMDIGIKLKGAETTDRFEASGSWNSMMTHRVRINNPKDINKELMGWLQEAYDASAGVAKK